MKTVVIIITYNGIGWIEKCLLSVLSSSVPLKIIVIDNNSTDGTQEKVRKFQSVQFIQCEKNIGFGKANNIGIKHAYDAGADYVFLLNQDCFVETNTIEVLLKLHQMQSGYGIISPMHLNGSGDGLDINFSNCLCPKDCPNLLSDLYLDKSKDIYELKFVNAAAWLMSKQCIEEVGGFNPIFFHYGEDDNYVHRLTYHGFKIGITPHSRIHHDRNTRDNNHFFKRFESAKRRKTLYYCDPNNNLNIKREIRKYIITQ